MDWSKSRLVEMSWEDILKNSRRSKRKREPYNPFTGKGVKGSEITEKKTRSLRDTSRYQITSRAPYFKSNRHPTV